MYTMMSTATIQHSDAIVLCIPSTHSYLFPCLPPSRQTAHPVPQSLVLGARNEYGEFDHRALALYGLDMVVEPYRETHLQVIRSPTPQSTFHPSTKFHWLLVQADDNGDPLEGVEPVVDAKGGVIATVELTIPAAKYALVVQQLGTDGSVVAEGRITIACKYVRRELRSLTDRDRTDFFEAMQVFYTITVEEGEAKYGKAFSNYARLAAYHNSRASTTNHDPLEYRR